MSNVSRSTSENAIDAPDGAIPWVPSPRPVMTTTRVSSCRCGHTAELHEHYRAGSECAACGCGRYRTTAAFAAQLTALMRRR